MVLASVGCGTIATGRPASVFTSEVEPFFSTSAFVGPMLTQVEPETGAATAVVTVPVVPVVAAPFAGALVTVPSVLISLPSVALGSLCPQRARSRAAASCMNLRYAGVHSPPYHSFCHSRRALASSLSSARAEPERKRARIARIAPHRSFFIDVSGNLNKRKGRHRMGGKAPCAHTDSRLRLTHRRIDDGILVAGRTDAGRKAGELLVPVHRMRRALSDQVGGLPLQGVPLAARSEARH